MSPFDDYTDQLLFEVELLEGENLEAKKDGTTSRIWEGQKFKLRVHRVNLAYSHSRLKLLIGLRRRGGSYLGIFYLQDCKLHGLEGTGLWID